MEKTQMKMEKNLVCMEKNLVKMENVFVWIQRIQTDPLTCVDTNRIIIGKMSGYELWHRRLGEEPGTLLEPKYSKH
jgi:hypothetical protein